MSRAAPIQQALTGLPKRLDDFLSIWLAARRDGCLVPQKADFDPVELGRSGLFPVVWLVQRVGDDFIYRICGEEIRRNYPVSIKDKLISEVFGAGMAGMVLNRYRSVADGPAAEYSEGSVSGSTGLLYVAKRLMLPLANDDGVVDHVIGAVEKIRPAKAKSINSAPVFDCSRVIVIPVEQVAASARIADPVDGGRVHVTASAAD